MSKEIRLKKGLNINLLGESDKVYSTVPNPQQYIIRPSDFHSLIPKLHIKEGDKVQAGTVIFSDKYNEFIKFCSPVSGQITDVIRGEKRRILKIVINPDDEIIYKKFSTFSPENLSREDIIKHMLESGVWPFIRQRPYDIIANPNDHPKSIFISAFSSSPLSIDNDFALYGMNDLFQEGLNYIVKLSKGKTHLNIDGTTNVSGLFSKMNGVEINKIYGPHPAGNVGVQIHHIDPINKGDIVWTTTPFGLLQIGRFFIEGKYDASKMISLVGSEVDKPKYYKCISGFLVSDLIKSSTSGDNRIISGNVLTGKSIGNDGYIGFYDNMITVIPEGNQHRFLGWIMPVLDRISFQRSFGLLSFLNPNKKYSLDTNTNGELRAFVQTGVFEKVLPMDILPTYLFKSILAQDYDEMEELGIYELLEEDVALCEFVDVSKNELQKLLRNGLNLLIEG